MQGCTMTAAVISFKCLETGARIGVKWGKERRIWAPVVVLLPHVTVASIWGVSQGTECHQHYTNHRQYFASRPEACG